MTSNDFFSISYQWVESPIALIWVRVTNNRVNDMSSFFRGVLPAVVEIAQMKRHRCHLTFKIRYGAALLTDLPALTSSWKPYFGSGSPTTSQHQPGVNPDEMLRIRGIIEKGLVPAVLRDLRGMSLLALSIVIGSYEMSNRIAWWTLAGLLALISLAGFVASRFVNYQEMDTQLIPEDESLERKVRTKKIGGVISLIFLAGWLASGILYLPQLQF